MALAVKTPGVYTEEISLFPPSVAQVETAVPAFIGYTQMADDRGTPLANKATRIRSMADFQELFGGAPQVQVNSVALDLNNNVTQTSLAGSFLLYDSMRLFFANGGSKCWIVSIGDYRATPHKDHFSTGLAALAKEDEPTLILMPDAVRLESNGIYDLQVAALKQCADLQDRFAIFDLLARKDGTDLELDASAADFRARIGVNNLKYGAAYAPWLRTNLSKTVSYRQLKGKVSKLGNTLTLSALAPDAATAQAIARVDKALADADLLSAANTGVIPTFLSGTAAGAISLEAGFMARYDAFRSDLADLRAAGGTTIGTLRTSHRNLYDYLYRLADTVVDEAARAGSSFSAPATDDPPGTAFVADAARTRISSVLRSQMQVVNRYSLAAVDRIGGAAGSFNNLFADAAWSFSAAEWTDSGNNVFTAADLTALSTAERDALYPSDTTGLTGAALSAAQANNMDHSAKQILQRFLNILEVVEAVVQEAGEIESKMHDSLVNGFPLLRNLLDKVANAVTEMPPSAAIAGVYAAVDGTRGVHKAPANVSLANVSGLADQVTHAEQADYNVDPVAGKSINIIRSFIGRGILVWGARTLDGNSNEWRYVSVRRFFNMVEESVKNATVRFVFEPNDRNTWVKVKGMIENFLLIQWRNGALAGAVPDDAFFVKVGLGETMTALDINEGRLIVEIGMAAVRPAEFIILRYSHKMQVS